ncbi:MAG: CoA transferase [Alphaproteobacteria bacterium]|jgi:formyl-CoA transferase|nr:CoA transferase [Alphaproteobacteria bacterium]MDP6588843.1 CoA transferase [Alphaproteobacteria bacterium]MDP6818025.1 CoA transferase [Alphaproteobacteria bacterium]|tara:strand:- start:72 stop:1271 length:1200 start_codon:yes stop_codon:yes gene_type:complete
MPLDLSGQALARFKVLDLTRYRAGPTASRQLADWGADVIKIEMPAPPGEDTKADPVKARHGPDFQNLHRNKRSLTLNLKAPDGLAIFKRLADAADVVIENYRPDVKFRLGIDYETLKVTNPGLVYASISGFGQDGPYEKRPGFDQIAQGMGGLMSITGLPGQGPVRVGIPIADLSAGMYCALGILVALLEREVSGQGQWVQSSLLAAQISMLDFQAARWLIDREVPPQAGNNHPTTIPTGVYPTADGHINIATAGGEIYERLCRVLGDESLISDPDYATGQARSENRDALNQRLDALTRKKNSAEWVRILNQAGVPCGPIYDIDDMFDDPQVKHLGMAAPVEHPSLGAIEIVNQAASLSRTPFRIHSPTPELGQHSDEILDELGISAAEISGLRERGVV